MSLLAPDSKSLLAYAKYIPAGLAIGGGSAGLINLLGQMKQEREEQDRDKSKLPNDVLTVPVPVQPKLAAELPPGAIKALEEAGEKIVPGVKSVLPKAIEGLGEGIPAAERLAHEAAPAAEAATEAAAGAPKVEAAAGTTTTPPVGGGAVPPISTPPAGSSAASGGGWWDSIKQNVKNNKGRWTIGTGLTGAAGLTTAGTISERNQPSNSLWDAAGVTGALVGGGLLGYNLVDRIMKNRRAAQLQDRLDKAKQEYGTLLGQTLGSAGAAKAASFDPDENFPMINGLCLGLIEPQFPELSHQKAAGSAWMTFVAPVALVRGIGVIN